jgi:putative hydrolase of the HAD superfamily
MIDAVLFDLGDTLLHFETERARHFLESATRPAYDRLIEWGFRPPDYRAYLRAVKRRFLRAYLWSRVIRREAQLVEAFHRLHHRMGIDLDDAQMTDLAMRCVPPLRQFFVVDGEARPVMAQLQAAGFKLGLVSNTLFPGFAVDDVLRHEKLLERFPVRVYSSDVGYMKPHRRIFEAAIEQMGVPAEQTVFVGDRVDNDVRGAARLGMKTILMVRNGHVPRGRVRPDHIVRALSEVPTVLRT